MDASELQLGAGIRQYGNINKVSWVTTCLISLNTFYFTTVHLNFTLFDVSAVKGCNKCDRLFRISL